ncbi:CRISPR-associated endonuclease Cas2 [Candidatus Jorgensenbacteria bacterium CG11_big_fil_rev_8_21_14_0_20_38_23]|uniref:CRISPR-associated endonuclease Cas2 n=1 Tax=Candidatus Jorgensenbacteria bacterium CG11_big_fil_rev_8_21_14_0_20_38_23 TaxID=1974594 RepID=A0A2H0NFA1_9BACT|nr:MAG: CRISPR-associated endonuclease Cas2 [Candidatus Jorgensenbacteria bacterium CG11_big_fil_rev_8_21_14_0_20_38_23]
MKIITKIKTNKRLGVFQRKLLLLFLGSLSIGFSYNPRRQFWILQQMRREWNRINREALRRAIKSLYTSKLIDMKDGDDGLVKITLTENGKQRALEYKIDEMVIKTPRIWDRKWRIVAFDIPEKHKRKREAMRQHLERLGFYKLQKSVFVLPYECCDEIEFLIEFYDIRSHVRQVVAEKIDNELHLKEIFKI